ncbi:MAG TPA: type III-B CRISPR module-associated protein Cmr5 [Chloroflexota bacterium]|jgi:CRISPR-associated protein Cmr5|nr:type III-B CRISPR module-associated protein Cmr5 [Chloroflexota bacterium]
MIPDTAARPTRQSLDQERAAQAARDVRAVKSEPAADKYRSLVEGLPAMILANGLGQTCAYLLARAEGKTNTPEYTLYGQLGRWLTGRIAGLQGDLLSALTETDVGTYRRAQIEALAYLQWLKRFAQAELPRSADRR